MATVTYNGVTLRHPQIAHFELRPVYDAEQKTVQYVSLRITVNGWLFQLSGSPAAQVTTTLAKQQNLAEALVLLNVPRQTFLWTERGAQMIKIRPGERLTKLTRKNYTESNAELFLEAIGRDVTWGPRTTASIITNFPAAIQVQFELETFINPALISTNFRRDNSSEPASGVGAGLDIMSHTSAVAYSIDQNHYTTRSVSGTITFRASRQFDADDYRANVFTAAVLRARAGRRLTEWGVRTGDLNVFTYGIPLPRGFIRVNAEYRVGVRRNILTYTITDREVYMTPPTPISRIHAQVEVMVRGFSTLTFEKRLTGVIEGNKETSKGQLVTAIVQLLERHITTTPLVFVEQARLVDYLYENRVAFEFHAVQAPGLAVTTFHEAGIFIDPPSDRHFFQDIRGTALLKGSGYRLRGEGAAPAIAPPSVTISVAAGAEEAEQAWAKQLAERQYDTDLEPGVIHFDETVELLFCGEYITIAGSERNAAGKIVGGDIWGIQVTKGHLYIGVSGVKIAIARPGGKGPKVPNISKIWGTTDKARAKARENVNKPDTATIAGALEELDVAPMATLKSKLGGKNLYVLKYRYVIVLEHALTKKIINTLDRGSPEDVLLKGVVYEKRADGVKEALLDVLIGTDRISLEGSKR